MSDTTDKIITLSTKDKYLKQLERAKNYYTKNKELVKQKTDERRITELLQLLNDGVRKCRNETLAKYNIVKNDKGVYEIKK